MKVIVTKPAEHEKDSTGDYVDLSPVVVTSYEVDEKDIQPAKRSGFSSGMEIDGKGVLIHKWLKWFDKNRIDVQEKYVVEIEGKKYIVSAVDRFRRHKEVLLHGLE